MTPKIMEKFQKEYKNIKKIESEDGVLLIYADDDTLWKILEDKRDEFNMEFEAGTNEKHFIRVITS